MRMKMMKRLAALLMAVIMTVAVAGCIQKDDNNYGGMGKPEAANKEQQAFNALMEDLFVMDITSDIYTYSTNMKDGEDFGIKKPKDISYDSFALEYSDEELEEGKAELEEFQSRLEAIDYESLSDYQKFVYDKMEAKIELSLESYDLNELYSPLAINNGWIMTVETAMYEYNFDDEQDVKDYQKLLETLPGIMEEMPEYIQMQIDEYDYAPNDNMIEKNAEILEELQKTEDNPFIDAYNFKIDEMGLDASKAEEYKKANEEYVTGELIPAFAELESDINEFKGSCTEPLGVYHAEGGEEYYNYLLKSQGFDLDAQEMFDYLYDKFEMVYRAQMKIAGEDYDSLLAFYNEDYKMKTPDDAGKMLDYLIDEFSGEFPKLKNEGYRLTNLPKSMEIEGMLAYCVINRIGDANGVTNIRVNQAEVGEDKKTLYETIAHEGYPGHMLHSNCYNNAVQYPEECVFGYLGYIEGWAMYAEGKAYYKMGVDKGIADVAQTDRDLNYTLMGLIDVAVNGLGYDAEELNDMLNELYGADDIEYAKSMLQDFAADPGLYISYSAGYWYTTDLIKEYKKVCGDSLSRAEMYEKYMSLGPTSFEVIRKYLLEE